MLRVSWTEKRTNLEIQNTASSTRKLMSNIKRRQAELLGHVMRKGKLEHYFVDNRKDRRKKKQRSSKNKNTRRYSSLAGKKHCGDVCGCKRSQKVEGHDRLRLQQTRQLMMMMMMILYTQAHTRTRAPRTHTHARVSCLRNHTRTRAHAHTHAHTHTPSSSFTVPSRVISHLCITSHHIGYILPANLDEKKTVEKGGQYGEESTVVEIRQQFQHCLHPSGFYPPFA